ncbi:MAG TPA: NlpC/P60 family protein [Streptosporangiaceae bacterium]|jgi:cell wall-associated NlpC family hydrolase
MSKRKGTGVKVALTAGVAAGLVHLASGGGIPATLTDAFSGGPSSAQAIAFAWSKVGLPYCWGGTGPSCFDCSGLVMKAYGGSIPRTSQEQWADLPHVNHPRPGDLVFAPGADGTWSSPGHVGLVIKGGRVIQAYATGFDIAPVSLSQFANRAGGIVGYARPGGA